MYSVSNPNRNSFILSILMTSIQLIFIVSIILFIVIYCNESIRFFKYPQHVLITFILQSQIINHNIYINSSPHDLQWVSYRYHDKRKSPINGLFTPFMKLCLLLKLNRSGRLTGNIIHYPIHMAHLIDDPTGHLL